MGETGRRGRGYYGLDDYKRVDEIDSSRTVGGGEGVVSGR